MIRFILMILYIFLLMIPFGLPALGLLYLIGPFSSFLQLRLATRIVRKAMRITWGICGIRLTVEGLKNIPENGSCFFVSNHRSYFDIFVTYPLLKGPCGQLAKQEFSRIPLLSSWMKLIRCVFLDRSSTRSALASSQQMQETLSSGISLWACPEGTRNHNADMLPFREGAFRPAFRTGVPIVPVAITNADDVYELHRPFIRSVPVSVRFLPPIPTEGLSKLEQKDLVADIERRISEACDELNNR